MQIPDGIYLFYVDSLYDEEFDNFSNELNKIGVPSVASSREDPAFYACNDWLIPTAIFAAVTGGFLNEVGKDLYHIVKEKLSSLCVKTMRKPRIEPVIIGTEGKLNPDNPFSSSFSIYSDADMGRKFKLLVPKYSPDIDYNRIVFAYLDFLRDYNQGLVNEHDIGLDLSKVSVSSTILVFFNESTKRIEWVDHLPSHVRASIDNAE